VDPTLIQKLPFIVQHDFIKVTITLHYIDVYRACHQGKVSIRVFHPQRSQERNYAEHITQLVMLSDHENTFHRIGGRRRRNGGAEKETEYGSQSALEGVFK